MIVSPAQRFQSLDLDTNLGLLKPLQAVDSAVYNNIANQLQEVSAETQNFINSALQGVIPDTSAVQSTVNNLLRETRDVFSAIQDLTGFNQKQLTAELAQWMPNDSIRNTFENLSAQCKNRAQSQRPSFKTPKDKASCGSGGNCSSSQVSGLLNKASGGLIQKTGMQFNQILRNLTALSTLGFDANLCKVFGDLIKGVSDNVVQKGAAYLLANQGLKGNTSAVLDIATSMGTGRKSIVPSLEIPGLVDMAVSNFTTPLGYSQKIAPSWSEGYTAALDEIQPDWNVSDEDGVPTIANICSKKSHEFESMRESASANKDFGTSSFDDAEYFSEDALTGAYSTWDGDNPNVAPEPSFGSYGNMNDW